MNVYDEVREAKAQAGEAMRDPESNVPDMLDRLEKSQAELDHLIGMVGEKFRLVMRDPGPETTDDLASVAPNRSHVTRSLVAAVQRNREMVQRLDDILNRAEL